MAPKLNRSTNSRTIVAPLAAFCMASILFVYARTSIQAAKRNAQKHREADGGQISWRNESLRRHGALDAPDGSASDGVTSVVKELIGREGAVPGKSEAGTSATQEERIRQRAAGRGRERE